ncbi:MAG: MOSC domain-containing protein [Thermomicrobiales bacterium]
MSGKVQAIFIAPRASEPMQAVNSVEAIPGVGLKGDRYAVGAGFYSPHPTTPGAREITLIDSGEIAAASEAAGVSLSPAETRRNLVTEGVDLPSLLGKRFSIGQVVCEGVRDCPPCVHLDGLTGKRLMPHLIRTGGLRARIVDGGLIATGDSITVIGDAEGPVHKGGDAT